MSDTYKDVGEATAKYYEEQGLTQAPDWLVLPGHGAFLMSEVREFDEPFLRPDKKWCQRITWRDGTHRQLLFEEEDACREAHRELMARTMHPLYEVGGSGPVGI